MKKHIKFSIIALIFVISLFSINIIKNVKADSGWDTSYDSSDSYDSGSSWDSSSSWSNDSSWDNNSSSHGSRSSKMDLVTFIMFIVYLLFLIIFFTINSSGRQIRKKEKELAKLEEKKTKELNEKLFKYTNKTLIELEKEFCEIFVKIQNAWMNFDYDTLKKLCSNEIYNTYYEELEALKLKKQQNIMSNFQKYSDKIINFKVENDILTIKYNVFIAFYDYVIDTTTEEIIKGNDKKLVCNSYRLEFSKKLNNTVDVCPNCGGKIESGTTTCEHCKAVIVQDSNSFVMSSKRRI